MKVLKTISSIFCMLAAGQFVAGIAFRIPELVIGGISAMILTGFFTYLSIVSEEK